jgi:hypothetical protein
VRCAREVKEIFYDWIAMPIIEILQSLIMTLEPGPDDSLDGPDFPFTYVRGHPAFQTPDVSFSGPYRIVVSKDRIHYTGERLSKVIFQLPTELVRSIRGQGAEQLTIRLGDDQEWTDIDFRATGLTKKRDMKRLIAAVGRRITPPRN